ncbi:MAG: response regulator transcription factor [Chloroflexi bacterium]|nr:response regulator transcription factor [Chloroflexota bacterium]
MTAMILLVEGKKPGNGSFAPALEKANYTISSVHTGAAALASVARSTPDLVVFDASSMRSSGTRTCRRLRRVLNATPLIHVRSETQKLDNSAEADVYLQLPFTPRKLLNRVRALLPVDVIKEEIVRYGCISLYRSKGSVEINCHGKNQLTPKLAQLLEEFVRHPHQVVTRRQLMHNVWKTDYVGDTRTLDVHIHWMRELIEKNPAKPLFLKTVRGRGYILYMPLSKKTDR